jgi:hypothetical protein
VLKSFAASAYLWSNRVFRVLHGGVQALFEGFWMGILPESVYDTISEKSYGEGRAYSNDRHLDRGFFFWEELAVRAWVSPGCRVLVAAAGGGRELIALARSGRRADGFDCSRPMVAAGQLALAKRGIPAALDWAPPCAVPHTTGTFDALIVGWNGYGYISPRARRVAFLRCLRERAVPGAPLIVSAAIRSPRARLVVWIPRVANAVRVCTFRPPVFEPGDGFSGRAKRHFTRGELERELADAGFSAVAFYGWGEEGAVVGRSDGE